MAISESNANPGNAPQQFHPTHWSVVVAAGDTRSPESAQALEKLCRAYWFPLYAYVRRQGRDAHEAQDLTQAFFQHLLEKKALGTVDPAKGKFRSFLLASLANFLSNERDKAGRLKRGGGAEIFSLDADLEQRYESGLVDGESPDRLFDRRWASAVVEQVAGRLRAEFAQANQAQRFDVLKDFLTGDPRSVSYEDAAAKLGLSVSAITSAIHRLRGRFRELFREEIANTVSETGEVEDEIRHLATALAN